MYKKSFHSYNRTRPISGWSNRKLTEHTSEYFDAPRLDSRIRSLEKFLFKYRKTLTKEKRIRLKELIKNRVIVEVDGPEEYWIKKVVYGKKGLQELIQKRLQNE